MLQTNISVLPFWFRAKDVKEKLSFLRRRHTDTALSSKDKYKTTPDDALHWSKSFDHLLMDKRERIFFFFGVFPIWDRRIEFSISTFSGLVLLPSLLISPSLSFHHSTSVSVFLRLPCSHYNIFLFSLSLHMSQPSQSRFSYFLTYSMFVTPALALISPFPIFSVHFIPISTLSFLFFLSSFARPISVPRFNFHTSTLEQVWWRFYILLLWA